MATSTVGSCAEYVTLPGRSPSTSSSQVGGRVRPPPGSPPSTSGSPRSSPSTSRSRLRSPVGLLRKRPSQRFVPSSCCCLGRGRRHPEYMTPQGRCPVGRGALAASHARSPSFAPLRFALLPARGQAPGRCPQSAPGGCGEGPRVLLFRADRSASSSRLFFGGIRLIRLAGALAEAVSHGRIGVRPPNGRLLPLLPPSLKGLTSSSRTGFLTHVRTMADSKLRRQNKILQDRSSRTVISQPEPHRIKPRGGTKGGKGGCRRGPQRAGGKKTLPRPIIPATTTFLGATHVTATPTSPGRQRRHSPRP